MLLPWRRSTVTVAPASRPPFWSGAFFNSLDVTRKVARLRAGSTSLQTPATLVTLPGPRYTRASAALGVPAAARLMMPPLACTVPCWSITPASARIRPR